MWLINVTTSSLLTIILFIVFLLLDYSYTLHLKDQCVEFNVLMMDGGRLNSGLQVAARNDDKQWRSKPDSSVDIVAARRGNEKLLISNK